MKISLKAIFVGGVVDILLSGILGIPLTIYVVNKVRQANTSPENMSAEIINAIHRSAGLYSVQLLLGLGSSVVGGYVAARIAKQDKYMNAALASWLCVSIGIYSLISGSGSTSIPMHILLLLLTPICYVVGAYLVRDKEVAV